MSAPASSDLRELERELLMAAERGETLSIAEMQEIAGAGHDDLMAMLDTLREHGKAVEDAPGDWRGPLQDELDAIAAADRKPDPVRVSVPDHESENGGGRAAELAELAGRQRIETEPAPAEWFGPDPTVRLTRSIAEALDAEALGKVVQAALQGLDDSEPFLLEILP